MCMISIWKYFSYAFTMSPTGTILLLGRQIRADTDRYMHIVTCEHYVLNVTLSSLTSLLVCIKLYVHTMCMYVRLTYMHVLE
jgi:hypothetical protein